MQIFPILVLNNSSIIFSSEFLHKIGVGYTNMVIIFSSLLYFQLNISALKCKCFYLPSYKAPLPRHFLIKLDSFRLVIWMESSCETSSGILLSRLHFQSELFHSPW